MDLAAACRIAGELFWSSRNGDDVARIKGAYAKWRAGSALAVKTMTGDNQLRWRWKRQGESAATASGIGHWKGPLCQSEKNSTRIFATIAHEA
jgi:hypothetical protein